MSNPIKFDQTSNSDMVFLKEFCEKVDFEKNQQTTKKRTQLPSWQRQLILKKVSG